MRFVPFKLLLVPPALLMASSAVFAEEESTRLTDVVVSAAGVEQSVMDAPASITVVSRDELESKQYRDLAEALSGIEGLDVLGSTGKAGGLDIRIRGMSSDYTLILWDGRRQNLAGDSTPNGFGDTQNSIMPPLSAIERIEVIRGPMSTLYGADAMGGVINIITRKVASSWGANVRAETTIPESGRWGDSRKMDIYATGPIVDDVAGLAVRGSIYQREASDLITAPGVAPSGRNPAPGESDQYSFGARLTLTPNEQNDIWFDADAAKTRYNNDDSRLGTLDKPGQAQGYLDELLFNRQQVAIGHNARFKVGSLESSLMHTTNETEGRTIPNSARPVGNPQIGQDRELKTTNIVADTKYIVSLGERNRLTVGGQYWDAELKDGLLEQRKHGQTMWSVFAEDELRLLDTLTATLGARYDKHDAFGSHISPRAYLVWNAHQELTVKGGVSQGFKTPSINQLIDGENGVSGQGTRITIGNPNLKPEVSTTTELGVLYDNMRGLSGSATAFHNKIDDKIGSGGDCEVDFISSCNANTTATYNINIDEAKTWGAELTGRLPLITDSLALHLNYTFTKSEVIEKGEKNGQLSNTPEHMASATLRWSVTDQASLWLRNQYRGESSRFDGSASNLTGEDKAIYDQVGDLKSYNLVDLGGAYQITRRLAMNAGISNLLDKDFAKYVAYDSDGNGTKDEYASEYFHSSRSVAGTALPGRTYWLSMNYEF